MITNLWRVLLFNDIEEHSGDSAVVILNFGIIWILPAITVLEFPGKFLKHINLLFLMTPLLLFRVELSYTVIIWPLVNPFEAKTMSHWSFCLQYFDQSLLHSWLWKLLAQKLSDVSWSSLLPCFIQLISKSWESGLCG